MGIVILESTHAYRYTSARAILLIAKIILSTQEELTLFIWSNSQYSRPYFYKKYSLLNPLNCWILLDR